MPSRCTVELYENCNYGKVTCLLLPRVPTFPWKQFLTARLTRRSVIAKPWAANCGFSAMAKQASSANPSIPLHEVLEAEFAVLHGKLPPDYPSSSDPNVRLTAIWAAAHALSEKRTAICISGGGIRSATFGLGVLQGLARCGLLDKFHYLSTVSGGGYIGGWLSAWIHRAKEGLASVADQLARPSGTAR